MQPFQQYQATFTAHLRQLQQRKPPPGIPAKRMAVYREIVFNNFLASVSACFPVLQSMSGKRQFGKLARHCFSTHHFDSPLFKDIAKAFVDFLQTLDLAVHGLPPFTAQLAHYEWVELYVGHLITEVLPASPVTGIVQAGDLAGCVLELPPACMLVSYDYPVHRLSKKHAGLPPAPTHLLVFRTDDFKIQFIQLNTASYKLLQRIQSVPATVDSHLIHLAETFLPHLASSSVREFGLQALHALYLQQAVVIHAGKAA